MSSHKTQQPVAMMVDRNENSEVNLKIKGVSINKKNNAFDNNHIRVLFHP